MKHFRTLLDLSEHEILTVLARAHQLKQLRGTASHPTPLARRSVAVVFEKASTRTRISFELGIHELGATPVMLDAARTQMGRGEPLEDTARLLGRYVDAVVYRTFEHTRIETMASEANVPVINGLSDDYHPCQILADLMTVQESGRELRGTKVCWVGDGNNVAHSWILAAGAMGMDLRLACPPGYEPDASIVKRGQSLDAGRIMVTHDVAAAAEGADVVTTDVWASMGQEEEAQKRKAAFASFQVDDSCMSRAAQDAIFLHCLPAHRGEEVTADVIDGAQSRVWDEAENRLHAQKALLEHLLQPSSADAAVESSPPATQRTAP